MHSILCYTIVIVFVIVYDIVHDIVHDKVYDKVYNIVYNICYDCYSREMSCALCHPLETAKSSGGTLLAEGGYVGGW